MRQLVVIVTAFTVAHSLTLSLAALNIVSPPARIIEPAIALSIVYVGADNLLVRDGRDVRAWIAFAFGFIHGFGFANVLREMDLPARALGWSLFSFNVGVEIGQLIVVVGRGRVRAGAAATRSERSRRPPARLRRLDRRDGRRRVLVHSTGVLSWRDLMRRSMVLGMLLAARRAVARGQGVQPPAADAPKVDRSREGEGQPLRDDAAAAATPRCSSPPTGVVVVDAKNPGWGQPILDKIKELTPKPITTLINTHTHGDHVSGNVSSPATVDFVAQENTKANMEKMAIFKEHNNVGMPKQTFKDKMTIGKGADQIDLYYFGPATPTATPWWCSRRCASCTSGDIFAGKGTAAHRQRQRRQRAAHPRSR